MMQDLLMHWIEKEKMHIMPIILHTTKKLRRLQRISNVKECFSIGCLFSERDIYPSDRQSTKILLNQLFLQIILAEAPINSWHHQRTSHKTLLSNLVLGLWFREVGAGLDTENADNLNACHQSSPSQSIANKVMAGSRATQARYKLTLTWTQRSLGT